MTESLKRESPSPLYFQLSEVLKRRIESGELTVGQQLPAEVELAAQYQISRMTVRQALALLISDGNLVARHGSGTFVAQPKLAHDPLRLHGFSAEMTAQGLPVRSRIIEHTVLGASADIAGQLGVSIDEPLLKLARLRLVQNVPLLLEMVYLPSAPYPGLEHEDLTNQSLYQLLAERHEVHVARIRQLVEATVSNDFEARIFGIAPGLPMLLVEGVSEESTGRPVEYFKAVYRGDRFQFALDTSVHRQVDDLYSTARVSVVLREGSPGDPD